VNQLASGLVYTPASGVDMGINTGSKQARTSPDVSCNDRKLSIMHTNDDIPVMYQYEPGKRSEVLLGY
jgi:hypothetical protein